jgi:hypothetical protein
MHMSRRRDEYPSAMYRDVLVASTCNRTGREGEIGDARVSAVSVARSAVVSGPRSLKGWEIVNLGRRCVALAMRPRPLLVLCPGCVYRDYTPGLVGRLLQDALDGSYAPVSELACLLLLPPLQYNVSRHRRLTTCAIPCHQHPPAQRYSHRLLHLAVLLCLGCHPVDGLWNGGQEQPIVTAPGTSQTGPILPG